MNPSQIAKKSEHSHQVAFIAYCRVAEKWGWEVADDPKSYSKGGMEYRQKYIAKPVPELGMLYAIGNGGSRGDSFSSRGARGALLKAEGVKAGVPDLCLPIHRANYHSLYIEMKKIGGKLSIHQEEYIHRLLMYGHAVEICYTYVEAIHAIRVYIDS